MSQLKVKTLKDKRNNTTKLAIKPLLNRTEINKHNVNECTLQGILFTYYLFQTEVIHTPFTVT